MQAWLAKLHQTFIETGYWRQMFVGLQNTVSITLGALCIGIAVGALLAIIKYFAEESPALAPAGKLCDLYITVIRGVPVMVLLLVFFFVVFAGTRNKLGVCILAFGLNSGAYVAEIIRGGIMSIDNGQFEAGRSLGFNYLQTMWFVVLPQVVKNVLPSLMNEFIALLKETSVAGYVAVMDLTKAGDTIRGRTYSPFMPLIAVALIYLALVMVLTAIVGRVERRLRSSDH